MLNFANVDFIYITTLSARLEIQNTLKALTNKIDLNVTGLFNLICYIED